MVEVILDTKEFERDLEILSTKAPAVFDFQLKRWLHNSAQIIHTQSVNIAKAEAKGVTSNYMGGFHISGISRDAEGALWIKVYNIELYSVVVEYGGYWKRKQPPVQALDEWVNKVIAPASDKEALSIAYAIARSMLQKGRQGRRGQKFMESRRRGRVMTMNRAVDRSKAVILTALGRSVREGLRKL